MTTHLSALALVALLTGTAAADPDLVIASHDDAALAISKIAGGKAIELYREPFTTLPDSTNTGAIAYGFSDAHTLWVLRSDHQAISLAKVVDGKPQPAKPVTVNPAADAPSTAPGLLVTKAGQVYLVRCNSLKPAGARMQCANVYERVDDGSLAPAKRRPADARFELGTAPALTPKPAKAPPAGYRVAFAKRVNKTGSFMGFTCHGPHGTTDWPQGPASAGDAQFMPSANKVTWYTTTPPLAKVGADVTTPIGEHDHNDVWVADCKVVASVAMLPGGVWIGGDTIYAPDGSALGTAPGSDPDIAP